MLFQARIPREPSLWPELVRGGKDGGVHIVEINAGRYDGLLFHNVQLARVHERTFRFSNIR